MRADEKVQDLGTAQIPLTYTMAEEEERRRQERLRLEGK
jgi:hypothetical protein